MQVVEIENLRLLMIWLFFSEWRRFTKTFKSRIIISKKIIWKIIFEKVRMKNKSNGTRKQNTNINMEIDGRTIEQTFSIYQVN